jgi:membrane protein, antimicrobial resistance system
MNFLNRFVWIFVSPARVFDDIKEHRVRWVQPYLIVAALTMVVQWLSMPVQRVLIENNPRDLPAEQVDKAIEMMDRFGFIPLILVPAGVLLVSLVVAALCYILVTVLSRAATFKQFFTLTLFASVVSTTGQLISTIIVRARGLERIVEPRDAQMALSLKVLAPESSAALRGLFGSFEFFACWAFVLVGMGLVRIFGMTRGAAIAALVPMWIIYVAALIASEMFGGGMG